MCVAGTCCSTTFFTLYPDWYLDHFVQPKPPQPSVTTALWNDWPTMYLIDPLGNATLAPAELSRILGGEICSWNPFEDGAFSISNQHSASSQLAPLSSNLFDFRAHRCAHNHSQPAQAVPVVCLLLTHSCNDPACLQAPTSWPTRSPDPTPSPSASGPPKPFATCPTPNGGCMHCGVFCSGAAS